MGQKRPLKLRDIWAIRFCLDEHKRLRDRALFDLAIDSKLRGCDLVKITIGDLMSAGSFCDRATIIQQKTGSPVQFEIMHEARKSLTVWLGRRGGTIRFRAGSIISVTSAHGNMPALLMNGCRRSVLISGNLARTLCDGLRLR